MKKLLLLLVVLSMTIVIAACGDDEEQNTEDSAQQPEFEINDDEFAAEDAVVLSVNEEDVLGAKYNPVYYQTKQRMFQFGMDTSDLDAVKEQTYNELIAQELIRQDAINNGIEVSEDEIDTQFDQVKEEDEEGFAAYLEQYDLTEDDFKEQIKFNLLVDKYISDVITVEEISEDEIRETYDQLKEQNEEIMEYEEAKEVIRVQLEQQKQSEKLQAKLEELEEAATIEKLL